MIPFIPHATWQAAITIINRSYALRFGFYVRLGAPLSRLINSICFCHFSEN